MGALLVALAGIAVTFFLAMASAGRYFDQAALAQTQLASVSQIEALALGGGGTGEMQALLSDYRVSIAREDALTGTGARELAEARELGRLAAVHDDAGLRALVVHIATRERGETREIAAAMQGLRKRMSILAGVLIVGSAALAMAAGWALWSANRRLEDQVVARTAALADSNARLIEVDRSRRVFLAKVSHELGTPVTVIRGEAEVALADPAPTVAALSEALGQIDVHADLLSRRVADLLGLARAEDGRIAVDRVAIDLATIVGDAARQIGPHARSAEVIVRVAASEALPVLGDAKWLTQALVAILDNGVKFSPAHGVLTLAAERDGGEAVIAVSDTGPGVMAGDLPRLFDAYYQSDAGRLRGGTGLGLALARWVVDQHGGTIAAASGVTPGCTITMRLPLS